MLELKNIAKHYPGGDKLVGALDTGTGVQVMNILKKISKERLVIMVTHNSDLANKYSSRIIKMLDGKSGEAVNDAIEDYKKGMPELSQIRYTDYIGKLRAIGASKRDISRLYLLRLNVYRCLYFKGFCRPLWLIYSYHFSVFNLIPVPINV